jgi:hypothetical protein
MHLFVKPLCTISSSLNKQTHNSSRRSRPSNGFPNNIAQLDLYRAVSNSIRLEISSPFQNVKNSKMQIKLLNLVFESLQIVQKQIIDQFYYQVLDIFFRVQICIFLLCLR